MYTDIQDLRTFNRGGLVARVTHVAIVVLKAFASVKKIF